MEKISLEDNSSPILTIIVVVKDAEATLDSTLRSITCDIKDDCEVLIMDGMSKDDTLYIAGKYPVRIYSNHDSGIFNAMNKGYSLSRGLYVMYINSGDELCEGNTLHKIIEELKNNEPDLMYSKTLFFSRIHSFQYLVGGLVSLINMRFSMPVCHQGMVMKRDVLIRLGGFNENFSAVADYELLIRAFKDSSIKKHFFDCVTTKFWIDDFNWKNNPSAIFQKYKVTKIHFKNYSIYSFANCCLQCIRYYLALILNLLPFYQKIRKIKFSLIALFKMEN